MFANDARARVCVCVCVVFHHFAVKKRADDERGIWGGDFPLLFQSNRPAVFYSFSFCPNHRWTSFYPPGTEIVRYLQDVCAKYGITDKIQLNTDVRECRWLEEEKLWEVTIRHLYPGVGDLSSRDRLEMIKERGEERVYILTEKIRAKVVCSAVGGLVEPRKWPEHITGRDDFKGDIFHSARWDYGVDLRQKNVLVVGTGCSAAQFVPLLVRSPHNAKSVTQLMRSPPWVVQRIEPPVDEKQWCKWSARLFGNLPFLARIVRTSIFLLAESHYFRLFGGSNFHARQRKKYEANMLKHMKRTAPKEYQEILTPDYSVGCKRRIFDSAWFPGLHDPRIELSTLPLSSLKSHSVVLGPKRMYPKAEPKEHQVPETSREIPVDVIVLANGFDVAQWLHPLKVVGRDGEDLVEVMMKRGGPQAYQGTAMDGFPNFFMIFGPNTATGHSSVILASENMVNYSLKFIKKIVRGDATTVEVKREAEVGYTKDIQARLKDTVWMKGGCSSWYFTSDGWNSTVLP